MNNNNNLTCQLISNRDYFNFMCMKMLEIQHYRIVKGYLGVFIGKTVACILVMEYVKKCYESKNITKKYHNKNCIFFIFFTKKIPHYFH